MRWASLLPLVGIPLALGVGGCALDDSGTRPDGGFDAGAPGDSGGACITGTTLRCGSDVGQCMAGTQTCSTAGIWSSCGGAVQPTTEICNGLDDDCDGGVDGLTRPCGSETGACTAGTEMCTGGAFSGCTGVLPGTELCDLGRTDEDCDGLENEDCDCSEGDLLACSVDGTCDGARTCDVRGVFGACRAFPESCDGIDNDCDGVIDNGADCAMATGCIPGGAGSSAYLFCQTMETWADARAHCASFGYHLVVIEAALENSYLDIATATRSPGSWWIGLNDLSGTGYAWETGSSSFDAWSMGEPSPGECGLLVNPRMGAWSSAECDRQRRWICEAD